MILCVSFESELPYVAVLEDKFRLVGLLHMPSNFNEEFPETEDVFCKIRCIIHICKCYQSSIGRLQAEVSLFVSWGLAAISDDDLSIGWLTSCHPFFVVSNMARRSRIK